MKAASPVAALGAAVALKSQVPAVRVTEENLADTSIASPQEMVCPVSEA